MYAENAPDAKLLSRLASAVAQVVERQVACGVDVVNDGEFGKAMRRRDDLGAWWSYIYERIAGFETRQAQAEKGRAAWTRGSKEHQEFAEFYKAMGLGGSGLANTSTNKLVGLVCTGPAKFTGIAHVRRDIANLKMAVRGQSLNDVFMSSVSPAMLQILPNEYYGSEEDYAWALAEAIREEYRAIVEAGFIVQIDDPGIVEIYDWWFS